jgi:hypothetical protein
LRKSETMKATCYLTEVCHDEIFRIALEKGYVCRTTPSLSQWDKAEFSREGMVFTMNSLHVRAPGSELSRLILSTHNHLRKLEMDVEIKKKIMEIVADGKMAVGFLFEERAHEDCLRVVFELMGQFECVVFDGQDFYLNEVK